MGVPVLKRSEVTRAELAKHLEFALLEPDLDMTKVEQACVVTKEEGLGSVLVYSAWLPTVKGHLTGYETNICAVVSYPHGLDCTDAKIAAARECVRWGATELAIVINYGMLMSDKSLLAVSDLIAAAQAPRIPIRVVIDLAIINSKSHQRTAFDTVVKRSSVQAVQIGTTFSRREPTLEEICFVRGQVGAEMPITVPNRIGTADVVLMLLQAGATRVSTSHPLVALTGLPYG